MTFSTVVAAMFDSDIYTNGELPGWSHPSTSAAARVLGAGLDFFGSDDLPGWSHPVVVAAA